MSNSVEINGLENCATILLLQSNENEVLKGKHPQTVLSVKDQPRITKLEDSSFDAVVGFTTQPFAPAINTHILRILKPGGLLVIQGSKQADFKRNLLYSGFANVSDASTSDSIAQWRCNKTAAAMVAAPLKLNFKQKQAATNGDASGVNEVKEVNGAKDEKTDDATNNNNNNSNENDAMAAWTIASNDMLDDDIGMENELEDENLLLENETEKVVIESTNAFDDCGVGGAGSTRKPCKNCTCGRAEEVSGKKEKEAKVKMAEFKSSCGSCHLGDAFRCSGCPYLGMPAFDPNEVDKVKLLITDDAV